MKRWKQIVRRIPSAKPIEERTEPAIGVRPWKRKPQWEKEETSSSDYNRCRDSFRQDGQFAICPTKKWRDNKENIDRHVRQNEEWHEGDLPFPFKIKRADVRAMYCDPVATAVNDQKQHG